MENKQKMIEVQDLCKSFHKLEVLKNISTDFYKNEVVSIIGPSGGGKSTFLRCLNLLEKPTSGHILFDGVDICAKGQNIDRHRQKMGMVFQQFNLFNNLTVLENIMAGPKLVKKQDEEQDDEEGEVLILKIEKDPETDEDIYVSVDDEEISQAVFDKFVAMMDEEADE